VLPLKAARLPDRIAALKAEIASTASQGKGAGIAGHDVQSAVEAKHHLIVAVKSSEPLEACKDAVGARDVEDSYSSQWPRPAAYVAPRRDRPAQP
jgi:hypothetical protein